MSIANIWINKKIIVGVSGGIAAYKSAYFVRLLAKHGVDVHVVMTPNATQFVTPHTFQALTNNHVWVNEHDDSAYNNMAHINLTRTADAIVVAPATANTIAKISQGIADNLLCDMILARPSNCPLFIAPAMDVEMWNNPATQRNIRQLQQDEIHIFYPSIGEQACGEIGVGRMLEPEEIVDRLFEHFTPKKLLGKNIVVTAGATQEAIDPVRYISNASSGKMGYAIARIAKNMGANVTLISTKTCLQIPEKIQYIQVISAEDMYKAVVSYYSGKTVNKSQDIFVSVAAVSDWTPVFSSEHKLKKQKDIDVFNLELRKTKDILASVANMGNSPFCVGFAAETQNLIDYAKKKLEDKNLDLIIANNMQDGFASDTNRVSIISKKEIKEYEKMPKIDLSFEILEYIANLMY